jgi:hypothetical protein
MSVSLSDRMEKVGCRWADCIVISHLNIIQKSVEKIQGLLQYDKDGYFT